MDYFTGARILLLIAAISAFIFLARSLKPPFIPPLVLIGTGFVLLLLIPILSPYSDGSLNAFDRLPQLTAFAIVYVGQIAGLILLFFGFYKVNRVMSRLTGHEQIEREQKVISQALSDSEKR